MMQFNLGYITWIILNELVPPIKYELIKLMPPTYEVKLEYFTIE